MRSNIVLSLSTTASYSLLGLGQLYSDSAKELVLIGKNREPITYPLPFPIELKNGAGLFISW